ncbi:hypothetical protein KKC44_01520 [Patescibacteria group bacterium]|nr:hypothetical protein [Patescibacteria group bacterium]
MRFNFGIGIRKCRLIHFRATKELQTEIADEAPLDHLGGFQRIKESTLGAVGNVFGGAGKVLTGKPIKGLAQAGQGVLDAFDVIPSAVADGIRSATGPDNPRGSSPYYYNISRAFGSIAQVEKPSDVVGATVDIVHASFFKLGSDALKAIRRGSNN